MALTNTSIQKALEINKTVDEYFETTSEPTVRAKDLMPLFMKKGIFKSNSRDGLPIRNFLRHLDKNQRLDLILQLHAEHKTENTGGISLSLGKDLARMIWLKQKY